jgi:microcin C transport system permease protein
MIEKYISNELNLKRWRRFKRRKPAVFSIIMLLTMILLTFIAPILANNKPIILTHQGKTYFPALTQYHPKEFGINDSMVMDYREFKADGTIIWPIIRWNPFESNKVVDSYPAPPSKDNWMGTDDRGRDVLTRLLYGFKYSISYAILVWIISYTIGTIMGGTMGYFGGKIDFFGMRMVEIFSTVPHFFLLIILISIFRPSLVLLVCISSLFAWIAINYYVRAEFLRNRKKEFVEAARALGASTPSILFKHILPNSLGPIITFTPFFISANIVGLASLDYLGFGLEVPTPSWGELLNQAQKNFTIGWWLAVFPSMALFSTLTMLALVGEGVRDAMDPNLT